MVHIHYALDAGMQPYAIIDRLRTKLDLIITFAGPSRTAADGLWGYKLEVCVYVRDSPDKIVKGFGSATSQKAAKKKAAEAVLREILNEDSNYGPTGKYTQAPYWDTGKEDMPAWANALRTAWRESKEFEKDDEIEYVDCTPKALSEADMGAQALCRLYYRSGGGGL